MDKRRQRPIPVTSRERAVLDQRKKKYEKSTGLSGDWGKFLGEITLLGLAAAGIYMLVKGTKHSEQSVDVQCKACGETFVLALPAQVDRAVHVQCPDCQAELVVDLA